MHCPLCNNQETKPFTGIDNINFWRCPNCFLIYKDKSFHLPSNEEKHRYSQHNNTPDCPGYIDFLKQAMDPTTPFLNDNMVGLDYGCGPEPVLANLIAKSGVTCFHYDPYFFPELPDERMDFVISTEAFEHFFTPAKELYLITSLLIPSGILSIMTHRWKDDTDLIKWWYMRDQTHVCFYHQKTFEYISKQYGYTIEYDDGEKVIILQKIVAWEH